MIRLPFRSAPRIPAFGREEARRLAPWIVAAMVYVAGLAGIGFVMLDDRLHVAEDLLAQRLTMQIPADVSAARIQTALAVLRQTPGIRSVHLLTPSEIGRLLEPWLGSPVPAEELPVPRLVDIAVDRDTPLDIAALKRQLAAVIPDVRLDDHRPALDGLRESARPLQVVLGAAIAVSLLLVALLGLFTTRAALRARRSDIELLHLLGAADRDVAWAYAARSLLEAVIGAGIGAAAILATLAALDGGGPARAAAGAIGLADWRLWAVLVAAAIAAGATAAFGAQAAVRRHLARLP